MKTTPTRHSVQIEYMGGRLALPMGMIIVGRDIACTIRFNDPKISREHLRLDVSDDILTVTELESTNGSKLNGDSFTGVRILSDQDVVEIGNTWFRITFVGAPSAGAEERDEDTFTEDSSSGGFDFSSQASDADGGAAPRVYDREEDPTIVEVGPTEDEDEDEDRDEGEEKDRDRDEGEDEEVILATPVLRPVSLPKLNMRTCPSCRAQTSFQADSCQKCGHVMQRGRSTCTTERIDLREIAEQTREQESNRRRHVRVPVNIPVIYESEILAFEAMASDISVGGLFIGTELLDDEGTQCVVMILPDGAPAFPVEGEVCHVISTDDGKAGRPPGIGIRFTKIGIDARCWLEKVLLTRIDDTEKPA